MRESSVFKVRGVCECDGGRECEGTPLSFPHRHGTPHRALNLPVQSLRRLGDVEVKLRLDWQRVRVAAAAAAVAAAAAAAAGVSENVGVDVCSKRFQVRGKVSLAHVQGRSISIHSTAFWDWVRVEPFRPMTSGKAHGLRTVKELK